MRCRERHTGGPAWSSPPSFSTGAAQPECQGGHRDQLCLQADFLENRHGQAFNSAAPWLTGAPCHTPASGPFRMKLTRKVAFSLVGIVNCPLQADVGRPIAFRAHACGAGPLTCTELEHVPVLLLSLACWQRPHSSWSLRWLTLGCSMCKFVQKKK